MGVYLRLTIVPGAIDPTAWAEVYDATLILLARHPDRLVSLRRLAPGARGGSRLVYSRALEHDAEDPTRRRWKVEGDESGRTGESFTLYRDLARYGAHGSRERSVLEEEVASGRATIVFDAKTQGRPYHLPLLAAAALVEASFPDHAHVSGDLTREQAEAAVALVREHLGREVALPVCVDPDRLVARLVALLPPESVCEAAWLLRRGDPAPFVPALLARLGRPAVERWLASNLAALPGPAVLGAYMWYATWLRAAQGLDGLIRAGCSTEEGPRWDPAELAAVLAAAKEVAPRLGVWLSPVEAAYAFVQADLPVSVQRPSPADPAAWPDADEVSWAFVRAYPAAEEDITDAVREALARTTIERIDAGAEAEEVSGDDAEDPLELPFDLGEGKVELEVVTTQALAFGLAALREQLRAEPTAARLLEADGARIRAALEALCEHESFALLERSWTWIDREQDRDLLLAAYLLVIGARVHPGLDHWRRVVLADRARAELVLRLSQDEAFLERVEAWRRRMRERAPDEPA